MRFRTIALGLACSLAAAACTTTPADRPAGSGAAIGMANPASVNCAQRGGKLQIVSTPAGQTGICTFPSGKQCEEWALMRGECAPG
ncbi:putative hemolysin [Cupriavidus sp. H39]|uniref:putative hemolysin n=1 Tax=Cupriavidus sp. H39 TaxID=3401635 RepID=UPI003D07037A